MQTSSYYRTLVFLIFVLCWGSLSQQVASLDTLLNLSSELVSANGIFSLGFTVMGAPDTAYLGLSHTNDIYVVLWIGNREQLVRITVDITGKQFIAHGTNGGDPIELYPANQARK
ncbi:UNVERIFIED_CONTAM: hypothetical protein Sradi_7072200 [Sesamum radiatum]|uniref:Uncharacterized protein n=1 Tax=Sesamum radiatum TaxID=300843 RepID=A0AAW2J6D1_SESRA